MEPLCGAVLVVARDHVAVGHLDYRDAVSWLVGIVVPPISWSDPWLPPVWQGWGRRREMSTINHQTRLTSSKWSTCSIKRASQAWILCLTFCFCWHQVDVAAKAGWFDWVEANPVQYSRSLVATPDWWPQTKPWLATTTTWNVVGGRPGLNSSRGELWPDALPLICSWSRRLWASYRHDELNLSTDEAIVVCFGRFR